MFQTILSAFCLWETAVDSEWGVCVCVSALRFRLISLVFMRLIQLTLPLVRGSFFAKILGLGLGLVYRVRGSFARGRH